jgi:hypothetical protein
VKKLVNLEKGRHKQRLFTITIAIPIAVKTVSPHLPVLNTQPFPLAITHALSRPFGRTYIASSPLLLFSSTNRDKPAAPPRKAKEALEIRKSIIHCGSALDRREAGVRPLRNRVR